MDANDVRTLVFSSSATVYGTAENVPFTEEETLGAINPYGRTKVQIEQILTDVAASDERWHIALLRYFNPVGARTLDEMCADHWRWQRDNPGGYPETVKEA